jgi:hypothetical protein
MRHIFLLVMVGIFVLRALGFFNKRGNLRAPGPAMPAPARIASLLRPSAALDSAPSEPFIAEPTPDPVGGWEGGLVQLAVTVGWVLGCGLLWSCLFGLPTVQQFPLPARLAAGLIGSFLIVGLARAIIEGMESKERSGHGPIL